MSLHYSNKELQQIRILAIVAVLGMGATFLFLFTDKRDTLLYDISANNISLLLMVAMLLPIAFLIWLLLKKSREADDLREQFYQSQKMEAMGRLAGGIAHDFNNILASSTGYAEFLVEDLEGVDPKLQDFAKQILRANRQAQKLVEQILGFSRKQQDTEMRNVNLQNLMQDSINLLQSTMKSGIILTTDIHTEPMYVNANNNLLHQLIINLCVNAVDAMIPDGKGTLHIKASLSTLPEKLHLSRITDARKNSVFVNDYIRKGNTHFLLNGSINPNENYVVIQIKDTGSGIAPETLKKIFDPFFTTKDINKGTGLGLSSAQNIIGIHEAGLIVETKANVGTSFTILIPYLESMDTHLTDYSPTKSTVQKNNNNSNGEKNILLVEDDLAVAGAMEITLERMGHQTLHCLNPLEALDTITEGEKYDIVISDYKMPHMNGVEFSRKLYETHPDLPVIITTGFSDKKISTKLENTAIKMVLKKPLHRTEIEDAIKTALAK